jgi:tRNA-Thr(GGU) m(6)t(6)A37 methyltransferase TsaA
MSQGVQGFLMCSAYYMTDEGLLSDHETHIVSDRISLRQIGRVETDRNVPLKPECAAGHQSRIVLAPEFEKGLEGLGPGDRLLVVFQFHLSKDYALLQHPQGDTTRPRRGVFALRSPHRPNPIGVTVVEILGIAGNVLQVEGLDAYHGSPVLDLKPVQADER